MLLPDGHDACVSVRSLWFDACSGEVFVPLPVLHEVDGDSGQIYVLLSAVCGLYVGSGEVLCHCL